MTDPQGYILIVGGKLQGTEACYLAMKAGLDTVLVDWDPQVPARLLCGRFVCKNLYQEDEEIRSLLTGAKVVLPAMENDRLLAWLKDRSADWGFPLAYDEAAYAITSSKTKTDHMFLLQNIPAPIHYPGGNFPYIAKPISGSGSHGVARIETLRDLEQILGSGNGDEDMLIQEYLEGPSYSLEVIGSPGNYRTYGVTEIHMDQVYDCCQVTSPCPLTPAQDEALRQGTLAAAEAVGLHGIMDVEVIDHRGTLKFLELDARIPSQTPTAVLHATGVNLLEEWIQHTLEGTFSDPLHLKNRWASYEHVLVEEGHCRCEGEHIMTQGGALRYFENRWGADEVLTDYQEGSRLWRATLINSGETREELEEKRRNMWASLPGIDPKE